MTSVIKWGASVGLLAMLIAFVVQAGPLRWSRSSTVVSNSQSGSDPYLIFLQGLAEVLPAGSTVEIERVGASPGGDLSAWFVAIGQLPRQEISAVTDRPTSGAPYLACYRCERSGRQFRPIARLRDGVLYRVIR
jgi:hypothetical protein